MPGSLRLATSQIIHGTAKKIIEMSRALTLLGLVVSVLLMLIFALDFVLGVPFGKANTTMDIGFFVSAAILFYMSLSTFRELT